MAEAAGPDKIAAESPGHPPVLSGVLPFRRRTTLERHEIPKVVRPYYSRPFGQRWEGCATAQRQATRLPVELMELLESALVRCMKTVLDPPLVSSQYAYQRQCSAALLRAYLGTFVRDSVHRGRTVYMLGPHIGGAFDSADRVRLVTALVECRISAIIARFTRNGLRARSLRARLLAPHRRRRGAF